MSAEPLASEKAPNSPAAEDLASADEGAWSPEDDWQPDPSLGPFHFLRLGIWMTGVRVHPADGVEVEPPAAERVKRIVQALQGDPRVADVEQPDFNEEWTRTRSFFELDLRTTTANIMTAGDLVGLQLSTPLRFSVYVPARLQPVVAPHDEEQPEKYEVRWNGEVAVVGWTQDGPVEGQSAGQVVADVLRDVVSSAGELLQVQSCNRYCRFMFVHSTIRAYCVPGEEPGWFDREDEQIIDLISDSPKALSEVADSVYFSIEDDADTFGFYKNFGLKALDLEYVMRARLERLLRLSRYRSERALLPLRRRMRAAWTNRRWRRSTEVELARIWSTLSDIEGTRRMWEEEAQTMGMVDASDRIAAAMMSRDTYEDNQIRGIDLSITRAAIDHAASRIDNRSYVAVTAVAAFVSAIIAAIVTHL